MEGLTPNGAKVLLQFINYKDETLKLTYLTQRYHMKLGLDLMDLYDQGITLQHSEARHRDQEPSIWEIFDVQDSRHAGWVVFFQLSSKALSGFAF